MIIWSGFKDLVIGEDSVTREAQSTAAARVVRGDLGQERFIGGTPWYILFSAIRVAQFGNCFYARRQKISSELGVAVGYISMRLSLAASAKQNYGE